MGTQIFIKSEGNNGECQVEYTKIVSHSFGFRPQEIQVRPTSLFIGGASLLNSSNVLWSPTDYNFSVNYGAGLIEDTRANVQGVGIPLPINLVGNDLVNLNGTAYYNNTREWTDAGWTLTLMVGVYYFNCTELVSEGRATNYTFIPITTANFDGNSGVACFSNSVTLNSNFDAHETRFVIGYNIFAECADGNCLIPAELPVDLVTVSHTLDIERPCLATNTSFIIKNCCEPIITELVNIPGLVVGEFYVDDEGNCWEVIDTSTDVTNFTRNFVDKYTSCVQCQEFNECPQNLIIQSCCIEGIELVSGSLPGLNVEDTFLDNHGLCWKVIDTTSAPISEESIVVDTIIMGVCEDCITLNPCPNFWTVTPCCGQGRPEIIATTATLNLNDSFVDTNGMCWTVIGEASKLPTNYNVIVDTIYEGCEICKTANPCPTEYFLNVRACCDPDRIEVISVPLDYMIFHEGAVFADNFGICWEVMSYDTNGTLTYALDWENIEVTLTETCTECIQQSGCAQYYEVKECDTDIIYIAGSLELLNVGSFYQGNIKLTDTESCFEVLGYGYPQIGLEVEIYSNTEFVSCIQCSGLFRQLKKTY
jgi:hypothetical protein